MSYRLPVWVALSIALALAGCGGKDDAPGNLAPTAVDDAATTAEDMPVTIAVLANDTDPQGAGDIDPSTVEVGAVSDGSATVNADGSVTFTPAADFSGAAGFGYVVSDRSGARSQPAQVGVTVQAANDVPTVSALGDRAIPEDGSSGRIDFTVADAETPADQLTVAGASSNTALVPAGGIVFGGAGPDRHVTVTPAADASGTATITVTVADGQGGSASAPFVMTVTAVNDAPVAQDASATGDEDTRIPGTLTASDVDSSTLTFRAVTQPAQGVVTVASGGGFDYVPAANFSGSDSFTFVASDGAADSAPATVRLTVRAVDDAPVISAIADQTVAEDAAATTVAFTVSDTETAADALTLTATTSNETRVPAASITLGGSGGNRTVTFQPAADQSGQATLTITATDGSSSASESFLVTVTAVNDAPVAQDASATGDEDTRITGTLSATDAEADALTFRAVTQPAQGTATVDAGGGFVYVPATNFAGSDSFTFVAGDGAADSAPATVTLTVANRPEPTLSVSGASRGEADGELVFTVALSRAPDAPVTAAYATADGTARAGQDYTETRGTLSFEPAGATEQTVRVPVTDDAFDESSEQFTLAVTVTAGADSIEGVTQVASGVIADDDESDLLLIGAAKRSVKPSQAHIDGVDEARLGGAERTQKFNLGGFGINPTQSLPNPANQLGQALTKPAEAAAFTGSRGEEPIQLRVLVMEQTGGERLAFVTLDAIGAGNVIQRGVKTAIAAATGIPAENVLFGQTHTHAGPDLQGLWGGVPESWIDCDDSPVKQALDGCGEGGWNRGLYQLAAEAAAEAMASRRAARLLLAQGQTVEFNNYRRPRIDPAADADGTLTLLKAIGDDGTPVGTILQYNAHPTSINESPRTVHADYIQGAMDWLEDPVTGAGGVALYYNGPIADASGSGERAGCVKAPQDGDYGNVRCRGEGIADAALAFSERELAPTLAATEREVILPITNPAFLALGAIGSFNRYYNFMQQVPVETIPGIGPEAKNLPQLTPTATTLVSRVTIGGADGGLEIVTIPGEATNSFGQYIRGLAKTNVMLLGLTHNSFGYIIPEEEFSYVDQEGDNGLVAPFTGYEENVSLGPLTAPLLRSEGYNRLFGAGTPDASDLPPMLSLCLEQPESSACVLRVLENRVDVLLAGLEACVEGGVGAPGCPLRVTIGLVTGGLGAIEGACQRLTGEDPKAEDYKDGYCHHFGDLTGTGAGPQTDDDLMLAAAEALLKGCDILDPSHCLLPFPSDHFTVTAAAGSPQARNDLQPERGGTGKRINFSVAAMPRNSAGKPIDPTEWNRNDGYSPGQMIVTYVPGLAANADGTIPGAPPITDIGRSLDVANTSVVVLDAETGLPHPVWAEIDLNAGLLLPAEGMPNPVNPKRPALIIRPATNFLENRRYVVVLKDLRSAAGGTLAAQTAFRVCRDELGTRLPPVAARCEALAETVFPVVAGAGIAVKNNPGLYLAWDFTTASAHNNVGRLRHMRDDAFVNHLGQQEDAEGRIVALGRAPTFTVDKVTANPGRGMAKRIEGTLTVPSYVTAVDPAPGDDVSIRLHALCDSLPAGPFRDGCDTVFGEILGVPDSATAPPNRLNYLPDASSAEACDAEADQAAGGCALQARYGDGLPDSVGTMTTRFMCQVPPQAGPANPARPGIYGHGLLDGYQAITYDQVPEFSKDHNFLFCAVDLFGFATGDIPNVAATLIDLSNFAVVPDGTQQGLLNYLFLARLLAHPDGFAAHPAFQQDGQPVFDRREVFYDGNSQGGIVGGVVVAASKDINRGVLGVVGMNYSTLLTRSVDFDSKFEPEVGSDNPGDYLPPYALPLYLSYTDDLDRDLAFSLMQMLWDRSENNGYAHHITDNSALQGPANQVLLHPAFADHQVTHWSAQVMARTLGAQVADVYVRRPSEGAPYAFGDKFEFLAQRDPDVSDFWSLPLVGRDAASYDSADCTGTACRTARSAFIEFDEGRTAAPPIGNVPPRADDFDPHGFPRGTQYGKCQKSHFLHTQGRVIDVRGERDVTGTANCPALPPAGVAPDAGLAGMTLGEALGNFVGALAEALAALGGGDPAGAVATIVAGAQQLGADVQEALLGGAEPATPPPATDRLYAGVAEGPTRVPVGTPLGGYLRPPAGGDFGAPLVDKCDGGPNADCQAVFGPVLAELTDFIPTDQDHDGAPIAPVPDEARAAHSPYATISPPTRGYYDSLVTKAVALRNGDKTVVLVKLDMIGMIDEVVVDVAERVRERTGVDLSNGGLMMSGTHTHDGPGALANNALKFFWVAMDLYQHEVYLRVVDDVANTVVAALSDMKPARFGYAVGVDTTNSNKYRRGQDLHDPSKSAERDYVRQRIGVLRVDDADGNPMAAIVNYSAHGIAFDVENQYFSGDVMGSVERELSYTFDRPVVVMSVQSAGGDVSPNVWRDPSKLQGIERFGKRLAPVIRSIYDGVANFDDAPVLKSVSQRIILNREKLGYTGEEYPYPWGAIQCNASPVPDTCLPMPPPDADDLADNGVAENKAWGPGDTRLTSIRIGSAVLIGQPGEMLTEFGRQVLERSPFGRDNTFIWGTSQDHIGYLLASNKEDWRRGRTEGTTTFWGWKLADRLHRGYDELNSVLMDGGLQPGDAGYPADEFQIRYRHNELPATPARTLPSARPGRVVAQPSAIERFEATTFSWEGGDPVVDFPEVEMQRLNESGQWEAARRANGTPLNTYFEMHLEYQLASGAHQWMVHFEAPKDWATGTYRFAVRGTAAIGPVATTRDALRRGYDVESDGFAVTASDTLQLSAPVVEAGTVRVAMSYVARPGNYRIIDIDVDPRNPAPVRRGTATFTNGADTIVDTDADGDGVYQAAIAGTVTVTGGDAFGNTATPVSTGGAPPSGDDAGYGTGVIGLIAELVSDLNGAVTAIVSGDPDGAEGALRDAAEHGQENLEDLGESGSPGEGVGLDEEPADFVGRARTANRDVEPVILTGAQLAGWSAPAAMGVAKPYPSGAGEYFDSPRQACGEVGSDDCERLVDAFCNRLPETAAPFPTGPLPNNLRGFCRAYIAETYHQIADGKVSIGDTLDRGPHGDDVWTDPVRNAYNGTMLHPLGWRPGQAPVPGGVPVAEIAAFRWNGQASRFEEIPVQVDERKPYFLANGNAGFSFYSGTDEELSYAWDTEAWGMTKGECAKAYDPAGWDQPLEPHDRNSGISRALPDPVAGLDQDDEVVFMAADAGPMGPTSGFDPAWKAVQIVRLDDALDPAAQRAVYLVLKAGGSQAGRQYVSYTRDADADQWIDRSFFADNDPLKLGTSNTGYGPNLQGTVCKDRVAQASNDRFPRDGVTVSTDTYRWQASGRWMVRDIRVRQPGAANPDPAYWASRPDLVDRWKGRAFQQSPDSTVSLVGFEDEQVNWEANSTLLGERCGPVRCLREVWGADSGTNVTKTETFYRDVITYRYHIRVHPIPPDGLYTSWDYNRSAMVGPKTPGAEGRYFTVLRPQGVPIDGHNDDIGQIDDIGGFPAFFDASDPTFNLPLAFYNWEQVSGKDDLGSLVYIFENKSPTSLLTPALVPYYRDDGCLDDGTGDDPVQRPYPGETSTDSRVQAGYAAAAGKPYAQLGCAEKQGAYAQHGVHYFFTGDVDNAALPKAVNEVDGQQWQFLVPTDAPKNVAEPYANVVRVPLTASVAPLTPPPAPGLPGIGEADQRGVTQVIGDVVSGVAEAVVAFLADTEYLGPLLDALQDGLNTLIAGVADLLIGDRPGSVLAIADDIAGSPGDATDDVAEGGASLINGFTNDSRGRIYAGVGVVDMTPDVGYGAGQYSGFGGAQEGLTGDADPYATAKKQRRSHGVMSRLTGRAIVVEGANGKRIALLKSDNYLAQDALVRRVAQILGESDSTIGYDQILYGVTHAHSTSYYATPAAGVWAFQDAFDARFFENQARQLAEAILVAERNLQPARMGATTVRHKVFKGQIMGPATGDDGTPVQYPSEYGDLGLVVMRFETDEANPKPIAVWVNWGEHPEGLDGYDLHSGDFVAFLERFVERDLNAPLVFSQGDVGSAERSGNKLQRIRDDGTVCNDESGETCEAGQGVWRDWDHNGYAQNERNVRFLADAAVKGWKVIGGELPVDAPATGVLPNNYVPEVQVPLSNAFPVDYRNAFVPGPLSHPYPAVSNCRSESTVTGNPGAPVLGLPDCSREAPGLVSGGYGAVDGILAEGRGTPFEPLSEATRQVLAQGYQGYVTASKEVSSRSAMVFNALKAEDIPVPEHYDAPAFGTVEENLRLKLQAFRLGDVILGSCACEAQVDLILNFESRANDVTGDIYDGFDWACVAEDKGQIPADPAYAAACAIQRDRHFDVREFSTDVPGSLVDAAKVARMRAQVHNPADGWDAPAYVAQANSEPADAKLIKGNFTKEELPAARGYKLAVGVGHAGDYNGYTVSYREYMSHDHYRKALTSYGAHTADYMVTRLVRMAGAMKGAPELGPEPHDAMAQADEARQVAESRALGQVTKNAYETYFAALPPDAGPAVTVTEPADIGYFKAATFTWRGGSTAIDNPRVVVERLVDGQWRFFADQSGEVQTRVHWPQGVPGIAATYGGQQEWLWTANFEAYQAFPARLGSTPAGTYRFRVEGCVNDLMGSTDDSLAGRLTNFLAGILPDVAGLAPGACRGGASRYGLESKRFEVAVDRELVTGVTSDAGGALTITVAATSIPQTYASLFPYVNAGDDNGRFCKECSFRPWATSSAPPVSVSVTVAATGETFAATGSGTAWTADVGLAAGASATITATYADGQVSRAFAYTRGG